MERKLLPPAAASSKIETEMRWRRKTPNNLKIVVLVIGPNGVRAIDLVALAKCNDIEK